MVTHREDIVVVMSSNAISFDRARREKELKKSEKISISSSLGKSFGADFGQGGLNWLIFKLLWRDFFRFITKKYGSTRKQQDASPVTACTILYVWSPANHWCHDGCNNEWLYCRLPWEEGVFL